MSMSRNVRGRFPCMHDNGDCRQERNHKNSYRKKFAHSSPPLPASRAIHCVGCTCPIMLIIQDELPSPISIGLGLEGEVDGFGFAATDGHFLRLITVRFLPSRDRVLPRRQICKAERPAVTCDGIVRVLHHREIPVHPRMYVALHWNKLRLVILLADGRRSRRLRLVPL